MYQVHVVCTITLYFYFTYLTYIYTRYQVYNRRDDTSGMCSLYTMHFGADFFQNLPYRALAHTMKMVLDR